MSKDLRTPSEALLGMAPPRRESCCCSRLRPACSGRGAYAWDFRRLYLRNSNWSPLWCGVHRISACSAHPEWSFRALYSSEWTHLQTAGAIPDASRLPSRRGGSPPCRSRGWRCAPCSAPAAAKLHTKSLGSKGTDGVSYDWPPLWRTSQPFDTCSRS